MKLLAIDTSTDLASVAISVHDEIFSEEQVGLRQHAQLLLPMIQRLLALAGVTLAQLDAVVFGRGPGSFTGLRIACSVAKGLAYAHDLPLYPVSSLAAIANEAQPEDSDKQAILAMMDARMHEMYWGYFMQGALLVPEQVTAASDITLPNDQPLILAGVGFDSAVLDLSEVIQGQIIQQQTIAPHARAMLRLVRQGKIDPVSAAEALPVYVRNQVTQGAVSNG
jgi:tRNA threonylcarbamoyladenosine biosynthesis protein TsaB